MTLLFRIRRREETSNLESRSTDFFCIGRRDAIVIDGRLTGGFAELKFSYFFFFFLILKKENQLVYNLRRYVLICRANETLRV